MRTVILISLIFACAGRLEASPDATDRAAAVLTSNRAAVGRSAMPGAIEEVYDYTGQGLTGKVVRQFDAATGAFVTASDLGIISVANGFDGKTPWMRDISGANTAQEGGDRIRLAVNEAYRNANLWWRPDRAGARISHLGRELIEGRIADRLSVEPRGGTRFDAWFDRKTHLLALVAERQMFFDTRTEYHDYAKRRGRLLATRMVVDGGTGPENVATMRLASVSAKRSVTATSFKIPRAAPTGLTIDGDRPSATVPFRLLNNHIYVEAMVEGHGPYTFIVDTGGHTILSSRVVAEVALNAAGSVPSSGAGSKTMTSGYAKVRAIAIGAVRLHDQTAITQDIYDPSVEGVRVDGMIGFELFRRVAVKIDYEASALTFSRFGTFDARAAGVPIAFKFYDHLPQVEGRIDGIPTLFDIDTGSRNEIDLTSPFVSRHNLGARFPNSVAAMTGWGVGGPSMSQVVRIPALSLGAVVIREPIAGLSRATAGSFSDANFGGNIGSGLLKRFVTSFDYSRQLMYLKPISPPPADVGTFDRSGMWINAAEGGFLVVYVSPGGAAEQVGIAKGDVITSVDGRQASAEELSDARALFRTRKVGERINITVRRREFSRVAGLVLRDRL
jgi:hypothetical protein